MPVRLMFLGTGTSNSTPGNPPSTAISDDSDIVLIDCGGGAYHQLSRTGSGFSHEKVSHIFLTHFHVDHVSGLPDFLWGEMWNSQGSRVKPLNIYGPPGLNEFWNRRLMKFMDREIPFRVNLYELAGGESTRGPFFTVQAHKLRHGETSTAYMFAIKGKNIFFTGDTGFCDELTDLVNKSDITVCEWSFTGDSPVPEHLGGEEVKMLLSQIDEDKEIYFNHIYPMEGMDFHSQIKQCRIITDTFNQRIYFPADLQSVEISGQ